MNNFFVTYIYLKLFCICVEFVQILSKRSINQGVTMKKYFPELDDVSDSPASISHPQSKEQILYILSR